METMAGEGEGDAHTQGSNQLESSIETLDGKRGTAPKKLGQMSAVNISVKAKVCQHDPVKTQTRARKVLMEVFSVEIPEFEMHNIQEQMYGCIFIISDCSYVVLDRIKTGAALNIDAKGAVKLRGPDRVIYASERVRFATNLFRVQPLGDQFTAHPFRYEPLADYFTANKELMMWDNNRRNCFDTLLTKRVKSQFGPIVVNYAVYKDAAEAWVDVRVVACQFPAALYGTITARNSYLGEEGISVLFNRNREERIDLDVFSDSDKGNYAHLPLSRSKTVHPYGSDVNISLEIMQCGNTEAQDQLIASNTGLCFTTCLTGREVKPVGNGVCLIEIIVTWHNNIRDPPSKVPRFV